MSPGARTGHAIGMDTALTRLFDLDVPVVSAPMAGVADARLAIAVSRAGALGCLGIGSTRTTEWVGDQLAALTDAGVPFGAGVMAWALPTQREVFDRLLEARPSLLSISLGDIAPWVEQARSAGVTVAVQVGTSAEATRAVDLGASVIVARGGEAGGHGENRVATLPLLQQVLDAVEVPVLAAGGIATARGLAAVLAAGAAGAWVGTAFAGCRESTSSPAARSAMDAADASATIHTRLFDIAQRLAWPERYGARGLSNDFTEQWDGREAALAEADVREAMARARSTGDVAMAPVYCGQGVGQIRVDVPAADVVAEFARVDTLLRAIAHAL